MYRKNAGILLGRKKCKIVILYIRLRVQEAGRLWSKPPKNGHPLLTTTAGCTEIFSLKKKVGFFEKVQILNKPVSGCTEKKVVLYIRLRRPEARQKVTFCKK
jgi:hypothetical protein